MEFTFTLKYQLAGEDRDPDAAQDRAHHPAAGGRPPFDEVGAEFEAAGAGVFGVDRALHGIDAGFDEDAHG